MRNGSRGDAAHRNYVAAVHVLDFAGGDGFKDSEAGFVGQGFGYFFNLRAVHRSPESVADLSCSWPQGFASREIPPKKDTTDYFDSHQSIEIQKAREAAQKPATPDGLSEPGKQGRETTMKRLEGKEAVGTGGNSGIGLANAKRFQ